MTKAERENWLNNIHASASAVAQQLGWEKVRFVLSEYGGGASSIESLRPSCYESVWNELFDIEREMKD